MLVLAVGSRCLLNGRFLFVTYCKPGWTWEQSIVHDMDNIVKRYIVSLVS